MEMLAYKKKNISHIKPMQNWAKDLNRQAFKEDPQMSSEPMRRCLLSPVIRDMQIKAMSYHMLINQNRGKLAFVHRVRENAG